MESTTRGLAGQYLEPRGRAWNHGIRDSVCLWEGGETNATQNEMRTVFFNFLWCLYTF